MSRFHGPQHRGATREQRDDRRHNAQLRDDTTTAGRKTPAPETTERDCE